MKKIQSKGDKGMNNEIYPIMTEDGKMFCKCRNDGENIELIGKNCSISIQELILKVSNPYRIRQCRYKMVNNRRLQ